MSHRWDRSPVACRWFEAEETRTPAGTTASRPRPPPALVLGLGERGQQRRGGDEKDRAPGLDDPQRHSASCFSPEFDRGRPSGRRERIRRYTSVPEPIAYRAAADTAARARSPVPFSARRPVGDGVVPLAIRFADPDVELVPRIGMRAVLLEDRRRRSSSFRKTG